MKLFKINYDRILFFSLDVLPDSSSFVPPFASTLVLRLVFYFIPRILTALFLTSSVLLSVSNAQSIAYSVAKVSAGPTSGARSPASKDAATPSMNIEQESALRTVGISHFSTTNKVTLSPAEDEILVKLVVKELLNKSYLEAKLVDRSLSAKTPPAEIKQAALADGVDGFLFGEISPNLVFIRVFSGQSGRLLTSLRIPLENTISGSALENAKNRDLVASQVADQFIETFPYRGFITKVSNNLVKINLGSKHGMQRGLRMKVFEFSNGSFRAVRKDLGEVEVLKVLGPNDSIASALYSITPLQPFNKIGFDDKVVTSVADTQAPKRGFLYVGAEDMNMDTQSASPTYANRTYKMSQTPFFGIGLSLNRFALDMRYGQARNADYDVTYTEAVGIYRLYQRTRGAWDLELSAGGRIGIFNVTTAPNIIGTLSSSTGVSPAFAGSVTYTPRRGFSVFSQLDLYYPVFYSGQAFGFLPNSISGGVAAGARVMFTPRWGAQFGGRVKSFRRAIDGLSSVQERQTSFFGDVVVGF